MSEQAETNERQPIWWRAAWWLTLFGAGYGLTLALDQFTPGWFYDLKVMAERHALKSNEYAEFAEGNAVYFKALDDTVAEGVVGTQNARLEEGLRKMRHAADEGLTEANLIVGIVLCTGRQGAQARDVPAGAKYLQRALDAGNKSALSVLMTRCTN